MTDKPYTVATLAARWQCSEQHIRDIIRKNELACFRAGRLIRIPAAEVERVECVSNGIVEAGTPSEQAGQPDASPFEQRIVALPNKDWWTWNTSRSENPLPRFTKRI